MKLSFKATKYACYSGYITQAVVVNFMPLLFVYFSKGFGLSLSQIASLITVNFGTQMAVDFFGAKYAEKIGYRKVLIMSQLFAAVGLFLLGVLPFVMPPYIGLILSTIIFAIGSGFTEVMVSPVVEAIPEDGKSASMSLLHSFYCWGHLYTVLVSVLYFTVFGLENWRYLSMYWAILPLITAFLFAKVPINVFGGKDGERMGFKGLFRSGFFWIFVVLMISSGASELSMAQWSSMFAETTLKVSKETGDLLGPSMFAVCMAFSRVLYGKWSEVIDLKKFLVFSSLLCVAGYIIATVPDNNYINFAGFSICGFSVGIMWPGVLSLAAGRFPKGGTALFGLLALSGDVGCFVGPGVVAKVSEISNTLKSGLLAAIIFPVIIIILTLTLKKENKE